MGVDPKKYRASRRAANPNGDADPDLPPQLRYFLGPGTHQIGRKTKLRIPGDGGVSKIQGEFTVSDEYDVQDIAAVPVGFVWSRVLCCCRS